MWCTSEFVNWEEGRVGDVIDSSGIDLWYVVDCVMVKVPECFTQPCTVHLQCAIEDFD